MFWLQFYYKESHTPEKVSLLQHSSMYEFLSDACTMYMFNRVVNFIVASLLECIWCVYVSVWSVSCTVYCFMSQLSHVYFSWMYRYVGDHQAVYEGGRSRKDWHLAGSIGSVVGALDSHLLILNFIFCLFHSQVLYKYITCIWIDKA